MKAIITGASSGIGQAIYNHLKNQGHEVCGISKRGPDIEIDLSSIGKISTLPTIPCDILILDHGILRFEEKKDWEEIYDTNFHSYWLLLSSLKRFFLISEGGTIIINASVSGVIGDIDVPYYAALKAGLINLTKSYAKKLMGGGIRVNCFSCGFFKTNLVPGDTPAELIGKIPMGREAQPEEILPVIDMLINCEYITGQNILVDGGLSL